MFEHCLYFNTTSLARQLEREWTVAFKPFGLTPSQAFMIRVILDKENITGSDLAVELNISKATCSRTLDGLFELGFIKKVHTSKDARSYDLLPTPKAKSLKAEINQASGEVTKRIKKVIGTDSFEMTVLSLRSIGSSIK